MKRLQRMPGASFERPRAYKLTDIEPQIVKQGPSACSGTTDESSSSMTSATSQARFPKLDECAHFHYEHVELGKIEVSMSGPEEEQGASGSIQPAGTFAVRVTSGDACWILQRTFENLVMFDKQLHRCIFDRKFSMLTDLGAAESELPHEELREYLRRFSALNHEGLNCGPVLNWLQIDNRGRRILVPEADSCPINTPAVAAAYAVRPYQAQAPDELSFSVGSMISVIDMPPAGESSWWRGKHGFDVGFFPAECVAVIGDKLPRQLVGLQQPVAPALSSVPISQPVKPVLRKHGKLIAFFRSFILNRPSRRRLKQSGILRERVFGCDLGEHLLNSGQEIPCVLRCCAEFIERHGLVDGIYRLSGVSSNIQRLRNAFDEDRLPTLHSDEGILQDIHSVASLLKMYFRELPNPLCTYQLYSSFVAAVQAPTDQERLARMRDAVRKLPPPHFRTLEYLMRHLVRVAARGEETGMTPRNVAIVWAPNLLRCKELEVGGVAALQGVGVQAVVTEFLICYAELIFATGPSEVIATQSQQRPKSLAIAANSSRLLSLEEARSRSLAQEPELIEVGPGAAGLPPHYHTVIELPQRKRQSSKRSPSLNWRAFFGGKNSSTVSSATVAITGSQISTPKPITKTPESIGITTRPEPQRLRPVKSADSIDGDGLGPLLGPTPSRPAGHSRSVSHDSYFEQIGSALDLSEIQLSFELEEREMRMLDDELEASPRRQADLTTSTSASASPSTSSGLTKGDPGGGSKRKRSRLEERLQCDVELRFIDSQSPDQVMLSADVHEMESPSPLPTPGYLPLLSEGSTPLTPTTSPRISFKSFGLPLEVGDTNDKSSLLQSCLTKASGEQESTCCLDLDSSGGRLVLDSPEHSSLEIVDQEMPCERLLDSDRATETNEATYHGNDSSSLQRVHDDEETCKNIESDIAESEAVCEAVREATTDIASNEVNSSTDLDTLMPYEQSYEQTTDSNLIPKVPSDVVVETKNYNDVEIPDKWLMTDLSAGSVTPTNDLQRIIDSKPSQIFPELEKCQTSSTRQDCQESMCYSTPDKITISDFDASCDSYNSNLEQNRNSNEIIEVKLIDLEDLDTNLPPSDHNLETDPSQVDNSIKSLNNIQNDKIENQICGWDSLLEDKNLLEINKNQNKSNESDDCNNQFFDNVKSENEQTIAPALNKEEKAIEKATCDESKESQIDNSEAISQTSNHNNVCALHTEYTTVHVGQESNKSSVIQDTTIKDDLDVVVPSDNAAVEPQEMAHVPDLLSNSITVDSSVSFTPSNSTNIERDAIVHKDTATILQELTLHRFSGGERVDTIPRRRYDSEHVRDRRSFDSEIGREIVREHKMKQELENARGKLDESLANSQTVSAHLPPCLRARHARATRAALSRSLDEAKFNKMTSVCGTGAKQQNKPEASQQHGSTPNVGSEANEHTGISESRTQSLNKNLGLDLDDPRCRERIEKYKEERRNFLRDKYRSESFRAQVSPSTNEEDGEQALLARLKQRASRPSLL